MMSFEAFKAWIIGLFIWGWIGVGIIAVASIWEIWIMFRRSSQCKRSSTH